MIRVAEGVDERWYPCSLDRLPTTGIALQSAQRFPSVVLTKLDHTAFLALTLKNGACKAMQKGGTSGDVLDQTIAKAIATVPREKYRNPVSQEQPYRYS